MKNLRMLMCLAGSATLFGMGCGGAPEQTQPAPAPEQGGEVKAQAYYSVCWPALGVYATSNTGSQKLGTLHHDQGDVFDTSGAVFVANGEHWVYGIGTDVVTLQSYYGYVRWDGLCH